MGAQKLGGGKPNPKVLHSTKTIVSPKSQKIKMLEYELGDKNFLACLGDILAGTWTSCYGWALKKREPENRMFEHKLPGLHQPHGAAQPGGGRNLGAGRTPKIRPLGVLSGN